MDEFYTPEEIATKLKVGKTLIYQLLKSGKLPHSRVGNRYRISGEDLRAYLDSTRSNNQATQAKATPKGILSPAQRRALQLKHFGR